MLLSPSLRLSTLCKIKSLLNSTAPRIKPHVCVRKFSIQQKCPPLFNIRTNNCAFKRTFFQFFRKPSTEKLRKIDNIPPEYILIYRNAMDRYILAAQIVSAISAAVVTGMVLLNSRWEFEVNAQKWRLDDQPLPIDNEGLIYASSFIILCVLLHLMVMKMPIRIYNYPQRQKYVFVFYGTLPSTTRRVVCQANEVIKLEENGLLPWKDSRYEIKQKQRIIMLDHFFRKPSDLNIMLGYQKQPEDYD